MSMHVGLSTEHSALGRHEFGELIVQAEARDDIHAGRGVRTGHERHTRAVQRSDHREVAMPVFLTAVERVLANVDHDLVREPMPGDIAPVAGDITGKRLMLLVEQIQQRLPPLPGEGRHLPDLLLSQSADEGVATGGVVALEQQLHAAVAGDEAVLLRRAPLEDSHQMLDALLPGRDHFCNADPRRHVADDR